MKVKKRLLAALLALTVTCLCMNPLFFEVAANFSTGHCTVKTVDSYAFPYPESLHNYGNSTNQTKTFTYPYAQELTITFSSLTEVESGYDYIYLYDGSGNQIGMYTGTQAANQTITIPGDTFKIKLTSDGSVTRYGYSFSSIKAGSHNLKTTGSCTETATVECIDCGWSQTKILGHSTNSGVCSRCGINVVRAGQKGDMRYVLDDQGILTVYGGMWYDGYDGTTYPWYTWKDEIKQVVIEDSVTSINNYAFYGCTNLTSVTLATSITSIGTNAFYYCNQLTDVYYDDVPNRWNTIYIGSNNSALTNANIHYNPNKIIATGTCGSNLTWSLTGGGILTISGTGAMDEYYKWSYKPWNDYKQTIQSVVIEDGITYISEYAFYDCRYLKEIQVSENNANYSSDNGVLFNKDKTALILVPCMLSGVYTVPDGVANIGDAFFGCSQLTGIVIPDSVGGISRSAFDDCSSLTGIWVDENNANYSSDSYGVLFNKDKTELITAPKTMDGAYTVPGSVIDIGGGAFKYCENLTGVTIPDSVTAIVYDTFLGCTNLMSVTLPDSITGIGSSAFEDCSSLRNIEIPDSVLEIDYYAFRDCSSLENLQIGNGVTSIGSYAFSGCKNLTSVTIPGNVTYLDSGVFSNCSGLVSVELLDGVAEIRYGAFEYCSNLAHIEIPDSVTRIDNYVFSGCNNLTYAIYDNGKYLGNRENPYAVLMKATSTSITSCKIHPNTKIIHNSAFGECSLSNVVIPDAVTSIGDGAFGGCTSLRSVVIGNGVLDIGDSAFYNCSSLKSIEIPDSVTSIGFCVFAYCSSLESIKLSNRVTSIVYRSFDGCSSLFSITIPEGVTTIESWVFGGCDNLKSVSIPSSVTIIGDSAFRTCNNLMNIWVDANNQYYSSDAQGALLNKDQTALLAVPGGIASRYIIPNTVTGIDVAAFADCYNLTSIVIPEGVTTIGDYAFENCNNLTSIEIPDSVTSIGTWAFQGCRLDCTVYDNGKYLGNRENPYVILMEATSTSITSCQIHPKTKVISANAFDGCDSLTNIIIPNGVTSIGNGAFGGCASLETVVILNSVTTIGKWAFNYCSNLTSIVIPESVTSIGYDAFWGCDSLETVYYGGTRGQWNKIDIGACNECLTNAAIHFTAEPELPAQPDVPVVDENAPQIALESKTVTKGKEFTVTAEIKNNPGFCYLEVTPEIPFQLTLVNVENGELISDFTQGKQYVWIADEDVTEDGLLLTFTFLVDDSVAAGDYPVSFNIRTCGNYDEEPVTLYAAAGTIKVIDFIYGDATDDEIIDGFDLIRLKKYLANYDYETESSTVEIGQGGDANGDGKIDGFDAIRLKKYLANYDYETGESTIVLGSQ